jgi:hypothetical protein
MNKKLVKQKKTYKKKAKAESKTQGDINSTSKIFK